MCGLIGGRCSEVDLRLIRHRGPDSEGFVKVNGWMLGHTRLAIQDTSSAASQPFTAGATTVTYNGELWNADELRTRFAGPWATTSDTEVVAHAIDLFGIDALSMFRGMFGIAWVDHAGVLHLARDPYGEVPLHYGFTTANDLMWASEIAPLLASGVIPNTITWLEPGTVLSVADTITSQTWFTPPDTDPDTPVVDLLTEAVTDRQVGDVPLAMLMSGGLDSSAIAALATIKNPIAYTAVHDANSNDRRFARLVANRLNITLVEVPVPTPTVADLTELVQIIEMPHKAQVEIAWACLALARRLQADGIKVILSGEGSDELLGSYGMAYHGIKKHGWRAYRENTFRGQHRKNFARTNKVFMRYGIEARLPFLHPPLVARLLNTSEHDITHNKRHPKAILAQAVADRIGNDAAWRTKAAFQIDAKIDRTVAKVLPDPSRFYRDTFHHHFNKVKP